MANIFSKKDQYIDRVNRSTFDLSFVNNFTTNFGVITPVCLLPVGFGDSVQINAKFNLQLMPTVFPIQTQMYARLHFVYVRTRTIWEDWQKFFGGDESVTPPWMDPVSASNPDKFSITDDLQTSALADYLGVPTTITGEYGSTGSISPSSVEMSTEFESYGLKGQQAAYCASAIASFDDLSSFFFGTDSFSSFFSAPGQRPAAGFFASVISLTGISFGDASERCLFVDLSAFGPEARKVAECIALGCYSSLDSDDNAISFLSDGFYKALNHESASPVSFDGFVLRFTLPSNFVSTWKLVLFYPNPGFAGNPLLDTSFYYRFGEPAITPVYSMSNSAVGIASKMQITVADATWTKPQDGNCPFYTPTAAKLPPIPLSALPFRVYEAYYNAFGRDSRNNPFMIDGKAEYNRYVPSLKGGPDSYKYRLHYANWEPDAYTTALQSPQAGIAPLVGISSLGEATFRDANGVTYSAQLETADDGDTVTGFQMKSSDVPADVVRNLIGMATSGISISDFRNVNSLQRFLEIRIRQSPRYLNLVKGLFNVNLDYDELMMPEFLGGISDNVPVYKVTQTVPTDSSPLGSFAGQGFIQSGMKHVIRKYCPEEGYILGVLSVVPVANYTQLLMPHWTRMSLLDWHFPQFNNVSFQPMTYKNLCPYQAYAVNPANIDSVFGYQRAWWDLISSFDEVHGQFRSSLRNFVINRVFDSAPELSQDFLLVNPDHVNDVFSTTAENGDKILGSVAFDITKKTTIPRNSIPHIE